MLRHVVLFTWTPEATQEQRQTVEAELRKLPGLIQEIREYEVGPDAGLNEGTCDFAVVAGFDDAAGYLTYRDHPAHRAVVDNYLAPVVSSRARVQFTVPAREAGLPDGPRPHP
jgi:Stress responsive A/B Barrel Domain